jgi:hypothetical protein
LSYFLFFFFVEVELLKYFTSTPDSRIWDFSPMRLGGAGKHRGQLDGFSLFPGGLIFQLRFLKPAQNPTG